MSSIWTGVAAQSAGPRATLARFMASASKLKPAKSGRLEVLRPVGGKREGEAESWDRDCHGLGNGCACHDAQTADIFELNPELDEQCAVLGVRAQVTFKVKHQLPHGGQAMVSEAHPSTCHALAQLAMLHVQDLDRFELMACSAVKLSSLHFLWAWLLESGRVPQRRSLLLSQASATTSSSRSSIGPGPLIQACNMPGLNPTKVKGFRREVAPKRPSDGQPIPEAEGCPTLKCSHWQCGSVLWQAWITQSWWTHKGQPVIR